MVASSKLKSFIIRITDEFEFLTRNNYISNKHQIIIIMANICTTNYVIEGKKEELDALYQKMKELQEMEQSLVENKLGPTWLGCLVKALGRNPENVLCRGIWIELERQDDRLLMAFETAWTPCYEVT